MTSSRSNEEDWWIFLEMYIIQLDAGYRMSIDMGILRRDMRMCVLFAEDALSKSGVQLYPDV